MTFYSGRRHGVVSGPGGEPPSRDLQRPVVAGREQLLGQTGTAQDSFERDGHVYIHSERWNAVTESPVRKGQAVEVTGVNGLTLEVRPLNKRTQEQDHV